MFSEEVRIIVRLSQPRTGILVLVIFCSLGLISCSSAPPQSVTDKPLIEEKYRITEDRKNLEGLRSDVPVEKKVENDELAFDLKSFQDESVPPDQIKKKFDQILRKKRESLNKDLQRERDQFTRTERKERESFQKGLQDNRKIFLESKPSRQQRQEFFSEQDSKRREFFADARDRRNSFEEDVRERRKSFEDYARERQNKFYSEWRAYSQSFNEKRRQEQANRQKVDSGRSQSGTDDSTTQRLEVGQ